MKQILLIAGLLLGVVAIVPYIIDVIRRKTKPNMVSWFTWSILTGIGGAAVFAQEGLVAALLPLSATLCTLSIVVLGAKYGFAKYSKLDIVCQASALVGLLFWAIFNSPMIALVAALVIDSIAVIPTLRHAYKEPQEETWQTFMLGSVSSFLILLSVSEYTVARLAYPVYLTIGNGTIASLIVIFRLKRGLSLSRKMQGKLL